MFIRFHWSLEGVISRANPRAAMSGLILMILMQFVQVIALRQVDFRWYPMVSDMHSPTEEVQRRVEEVTWPDSAGQNPLVSQHTLR